MTTQAALTIRTANDLYRAAVAGRRRETGETTANAIRRIGRSQACSLAPFKVEILALGFER